MADDPDAENDQEKEYPGGRVGLNARIIKDKESDTVVIQEIRHGHINDGYDKYLYEDEGRSSKFRGQKTDFFLVGLTKDEQEESREVTCCVMDCIWYVIFRFCR